MATKVKTGVLGTLTELNFADNGKARFGAGNDLQIYHNGSNASIISDNNAASDLLIQSNNIVLENTSGHNMIHMASGGAVQLYHNNVSKVKTTATGAQIGLNNSTITRLQLYGATSAEHQIKFGNDGTNGEKDGAIRYFGEAHSTTANRRAMTFSTAQTEKMRINASGKVGIATTTNHAGSALGYMLTIDSEGASGSIFEAHRTGNSRLEIYQNATGGNYIDSLGTTAFTVFATGGTERMRIDASGHVGIGRAPESDYYSGIKALALGNGPVIYASTSGNPNLTFNDNLFINSAGNNEYQTSNPGTRLEQFNGTLTFNNAPSGTAGQTATLTERFRIDASGRVTKPTQPYFEVYRNGNQTGYNASGNYAAVVVYNSATHNVGGHYNTSTGYFTAPVAGIYCFTAAAYCNFSAGQSWFSSTSGRINGTDTVYSAGKGFPECHTILKLGVGDTVGYHPYKDSMTNGTINANGNHTYFKGYLLG